MGLVLHGILNAPWPDNPSEMGVVEWVQIKSAMREASAEIDRMHLALGEILEDSTLETAKARALVALPDHDLA